MAFMLFTHGFYICLCKRNDFPSGMMKIANSLYPINEIKINGPF